MNYAFILAGGRGERLWPLSRIDTPKQLLRLVSDHMMIEDTISRLEGYIPLERIFVICGHELSRKMLSHVPGLTEKNFIVEPAARNSAPAIYLASAFLRSYDPDGVMHVLPSDHYISPREEFHEALKKASEMAAREKGLMTLGVKPTHPETGYGYIINRDESNKVKEFTEKPDYKTAVNYIKTDKAYWNSGMFIWENKVFIDEVKKHQFNDYMILEELMNLPIEDIRRGKSGKVFRKFTANSIDYAIMEKSKNVYCIPVSFQWNDLGSWNSLEDIIPHDENNNVKNGKVLAVESKNNIFYSKERLIAAYGVEGLAIISTDDAILVCAKERSADVKRLLKFIKNNEDLEGYL